MSRPTSRWMRYALDALQIEETVAKYVLSFRRSWQLKHRTNDLIKDTLLTARLLRTAGMRRRLANVISSPSAGPGSISGSGPSTRFWKTIKRHEPDEGRDLREA